MNAKQTALLSLNYVDGKWHTYTTKRSIDGWIPEQNTAMNKVMVIKLENLKFFWWVARTHSTIDYDCEWSLATTSSSFHFCRSFSICCFSVFSLFHSSLLIFVVVVVELTWWYYLYECGCHCDYNYDCSNKINQQQQQYPSILSILYTVPHTMWGIFIDLHSLKEIWRFPTFFWHKSYFETRIWIDSSYFPSIIWRINFVNWTHCNLVSMFLVMYWPPEIYKFQFGGGEGGINIKPRCHMVNYTG